MGMWGTAVGPKEYGKVKGRLKRFIAVSDNHGNHVDEASSAAMFDFLKWFKPDQRIHLGDNWDFACLRRGASDEEKRESIRDDVDAGLAFLDKFKPTVFLRGNHDARLWDAIESDDGKLADFAGYLASDIEDALKGVKVYPYCKRRGVHQMGDTACIHGYHAGLTAVRQAALIYLSMMMGHIHTVEAVSVPGLKPRVGRAIGCMCELNMKYNRGHANTLRQEPGFAYGFNHPDGTNTIFQAQRIGGRWYLPSEWREFSGATKN